MRRVGASLGGPLGFLRALPATLDLSPYLAAIGDKEVASESNREVELRRVIWAAVRWLQFLFQKLMTLPLGSLKTGTCPGGVPRPQVAP